MCTPTLTAYELRKALAFADDLLQARSFADLAERVLPGMAELLRADFAVYHRMNLLECSEFAVPWPHDVTPTDAYASVVAEHPLVQHAVLRPQDNGPRLISDLVSRRQWKESAVYRESHRYLGIDDQMAIILGRQGAEIMAFSVSRSGRNFREAERDLAQLLTRHLEFAACRVTSAPGPKPAYVFASRILAAQLPPPLRALPATHPLTPRETEILTLASTGLTSRQIARRLNCGERTVNKHLERIYVKLNVTNRVAAANLLNTTY